MTQEEKVKKLFPYTEDWLRKLFSETFEFSYFLTEVMKILIMEKETDIARKKLQELQNEMPSAEVLLPLKEYIEETILQAPTSNNLREEYEALNSRIVMALNSLWKGF